MKQFISFLLIALGLVLFSHQSALFAAAGDIYAADSGSGTIFRFTPAGAKTPFATGLNQPNGLTFDQAGNLYATERTNGTVLKITPSGIKTIYASGLNTPQWVAIDTAGNLFVTQNFTTNVANRDIIKITPSGTKTIFAGGLANPGGLAFDSAGNLYVSDGSINAPTAIYKYTPSGTRTTFATPSYNMSKNMAFDSKGNLFLAGGNNIEKFTPDGMRSTFAPSSIGPFGLVINKADQLYVSVPTNNNNTIYKYTTDAFQSTFAGSLNVPSGLAIEAPRGNSLNISTRLGVQTGDNALIAGFIITGPAHKSVLVRGMGPSLGNVGVSGALQDPTIEMHFPTGVVISNDNWKDSNTAPNIQGTAFAPTDDRESTLGFHIPPGNYTVIERGVGNTAGVGLVEVYDRGPSENSRLANISTRGFVGGGDNVMIGGFILGGNGARVAVRALGPSLASVGVSNALSDPVLSLRDGNGTEIGFSDDWGFSFGGDDGNGRQLQEAGLAPSDTHESAIITVLPNGNFTAIVSGFQGATGIGLVEVYNLQ